MAISHSPTDSAEPKLVLNQSTVLTIFSALLVAMFLSSMDQTIVSTALPTIVGELGGVEHQTWVTTAYLLTSTVVMPIYGKFGDMLGRRQLFIIAISIFLAGSIICSLATGFTWFVAGRAIQGLGGGGLMILSQAIIADIAPAQQRGKFMGIMGAVFGVSAVIAPLLGGYFVDHLTWRWAFYINIPLGVLALIIAFIYLKLPSHRPTKKLDIWGVASLTLTTTGLIFFTDFGGSSDYGWSDPLTLIWGSVALVSMVAFIFIEQRAEDPIIPLSLFRNQVFVTTTTIGFFIGMSMMAALSFIPTFLQMVTGTSAAISGLLMLPMVGGLMVTSIWATNKVSITGRYKAYPIAGTAVVILALLWMSSLSASTSLWVICGMLLVFGLGLGLVMQVLVLVVQSAVPYTQLGTATSANNYFREMGASVGVAIFGTMFTSKLSSNITSFLSEQNVDSDSIATIASSISPSMLKELPENLQGGIVEAYASSLAPVFGYLIPFMVVAFVIALCVKKITLQTESGMVARGEAVVEE